MPRIEVNTELCDGCKACVNACPVDVFMIEEGKAKPNNIEMCMACRFCEVECPNTAIKVFD